MTDDWTHKRKMQEEQHKHELKLKIMDVFISDPTAKYWAAIGIGAGSILVMELFENVGQSLGGTAGGIQPGPNPPPPTTGATADDYTVKEYLNLFHQDPDAAKAWKLSLSTEERFKWDLKEKAWMANPFNTATEAFAQSGKIFKDITTNINPFAWMNTIPEQLASGWIGINVVALVLHEVFGNSDKGINLVRSVIEAAGDAVPF